MADRTYLIEVILQARNDMARAFAEATGEIDAYDKKLEEQAAKTKALQETQREFAKDFESGTPLLERRTKAIQALNEQYGKLGISTDKNSAKAKEQIVALRNLEAAQSRVISIQRKGLQGTSEYAEAQIELGNATSKLSRVLETSQGLSRTTARNRANEIQSIIELNQRTAETIEIESRLQAQREQIAQKAHRPASVLADPRSSQLQEIKATKELEAAYDELKLTGLDAAEAESKLHSVRQKALADYGFATKAARTSAQAELSRVAALEEVAKATAKVNRSTLQNPVSAAVYNVGTTKPSGTTTQIDVSSAVGNVEKQFSKLGNSVDGFNKHIRNTLGVTLTASVQPIAALLLGLIGTFSALASAAVAAGAAMSTTFASIAAQGVPVVIALGATMQRLQNVMGLVSGLAGLQQQKFIAGYTAAYQNSLGINQVTIAEHSYSDALYSVQQSIQGVSIAELALRTARQQATRQLQELIFQEESARLAAEASSLAVVNAQKSLQQAIASGGDVQGAQLQLAQAHVQHQQSVAQARNAIIDAAQGSLARQNIQQQVTQAQRAVTQAQRAVVDAQFAAAQARAAVIQAVQAQHGFNIATAAQLAYLRSQMTATELSLTNNILKIFKLFRGAHGILTPVTNAILAPFVGITNEIYKLLHDPRILAALHQLGLSIGSAISEISKVFLSPQGINVFISLVKAAAQNMKPLADIISSAFRGFGALLVTAEPFIHQFALFIANIAEQFAKWAQSTAGKNWLKQFFDVAFKSLEAFINLGLAIGKLLGAIITTGGGAKAGISLLQEFINWINKTTASIEHHGKAWHTLQDLWVSIKPTLHALATILGAIGHAFIQLGATNQGRSALQGIADFIAHVIIPAFTQFAENIGKVINKFTLFLRQHPQLEKFLKDLIALSLTASVGFKALSVLLGPLFTIIKVFEGAKGLFDAIKIFWEALPEEVAAVLGPIGLVAAGIVAIAAATHNLGKLISEVLSPFKLIWKDIRDALRPLGQAIDQVGKALGINLGGNAHKVVAGILTAFGILARFIATVFIIPLTNAIALFTNVFKTIAGIINGLKKVFQGVLDVIDGIIHLNGKKIIHGFAEIGKGVFDALKAAFLFIPNLLIGIFKNMVRDVENFLGISSPSKKFKSIGKAIVDGIISAVSSLPRLFLDLGIKLVKAMIHGISSLAGDVGRAIIRLIPSPIRSIIGGALHIGGGGGGGILGAATNIIGAATNPIGTIGNIVSSIFSEGGPVPGFGGGDKHIAALEGGEHVWTKDEVASAGGHSAMFAMRSFFGGGRQGGPFGYSYGGAVTPRTGGNVSSNNQNIGGPLGKVLSTILLFSRDFSKDWQNMWSDISDSTHDGIVTQENDFRSFFRISLKLWNNFNSTLTDSIGSFWTQINNSAKQNLNDLYENFKSVYTQFDTDTFNAFWYIAHSANQSLKAFGAKPVDVTLSAIPSFAEGGFSGFVGNVGERGRDAIHAVLGRGEAVLNWAHQRMVEPAMRAMYGFGLGDMFKKVNATHAGGQSEGYSTGGYVYPFPPGTTIGRTDQGVDADMPVGSPIGPIGRARIVGHLSNWYKGQPYIWWQLLDGIKKGAYAYVAEQITNLAPINAIVSARQAVADFASGGTGIEYGWATSSGQTLARVSGGYTEGQVTQAGQSMRNFISGLAHGKLLGGGQVGPPGIAAHAAQAMNMVKQIHVRGSGVLKDVLSKAVRKVTNAANEYLGQSGATSGGQSVPGASGLSGNLKNIVGQLAQRFHWVQYINDWLNVINRESGGSTTARNASSGAFGVGQLNPSSGTLQEYAKYGSTSTSLPKQLYAMAMYILNTYGNPAKAWASELTRGWYAKGGFAGDAMPIIAHAGEWVVNRVQQSKLAKRIGTTVGSLKDSLGFSGGPRSFGGGGVVGDSLTPIGGDLGGASSSPYSSLEIPGPSPKGSYSLPNISIDLPNFYQQAISAYNQSQQITIGLERSGKKLNSGISQFLSNYNLVGGDNGLFAIAAQAIQDFIAKQQTIVQLAAVGIRVANNVLKQGRAQTALQAAQADLTATNQQISAISSLQAQQASALSDVNKEIKKLGRPTSKNLKQYQQLIAARQNLINDINQQDQNLAQAYSDQYNKAVAFSQASLDQALQGTGTLTGGQLADALSNIGKTFKNIGPQIAAGIASTQQAVAQAFGRPQDIAASDQAVVNAAQASQQALQAAYNDAAQKAQKDPRWQSVANQLQSQLESAIAGTAQAQVQAMADAITNVQNQAQITSSRLALASVVATALSATSNVLGPANQFAAIGQQIGISQATSASLQNQIGQYQNLYNQAALQGNTGAMQQLQQTINDLTGQMIQANVNTQQLITSYHQLAVTILSTQSQSTSGFIQAANSITQTLGQIAGSQNLPALIASAKQYATDLQAEGSQAIQAIIGTINDIQQPFGAASGQANTFLSQAIGAFNQGPQGFANWLAMMAPTLATFQAGLPQDQAALFQGLIQALTDNTTATVNNTLNLQQLNATTNQQQFTSTAWTMFREAIFNGLGRLLPQYAMQVPSLDVGGMLISSGLMYGHKGEEIIPAGVSRSSSSSSKTVNNQNHFHITTPTEVADPVYLGNATAWRLNHDPNSR